MQIGAKHFALLITSLILVSGCSASADSENQSANSTSSTSAPIPPEPTSLQDLVENSDAAAYWAWKKSSEKVLNSSPIAKKAIVEIGPNTTPDYLSPQFAIDLASKLYSDHKQNQELTFIYYEHEDTAWAQKKLNDFLGKQCALIAVDELITEGFFTDGYYNRAAFWQEVKQEIEKL